MMVRKMRGEEEMADWGNEGVWEGKKKKENQEKKIGVQILIEVNEDLYRLKINCKGRIAGRKANNVTNVQNNISLKN